MESYTIRKQDGKLEGPYSLRVIKAFIIAGKLTEKDTLITSEGEYPLAHHPEFRIFWEPGTEDDLDAVVSSFEAEGAPPVEGRVVFYRGKVLPPGPGPTYAGNFLKFAYTHLLYRLYLAKETGRLHVRHGRDVVEVFLEHGKPAYAASNDQSTAMGEVLLREGLIERDPLERALHQSETEDRPLGQILIQNNIVPSKSIHTALNLQFKRRIFTPLGWNSNTVYRFYRNQITGAQFPLEYDFFHLLQEGAMQWLPEARLNERLLPQQHRRVARMAHPKLNLESFNLDTAERKLYLNILNRDPLDDVIGDAVESGLLLQEQASRVLFLLWQTDLLHMKEELMGTRTQRVVNELSAYINRLSNQNRLQRLGLKGGASPHEIRQAYLNLAREYHPDLLPPGTHAEVARKMSEAFALIADAYSVLTAK
ncbi:MAG: hypothetical protein EP343_11575 [Deltaproteobacteria bacterium]|nr:MAG: hypothetical protein EP343_11575 [Deltaproteobacteria bacterium]